MNPDIILALARRVFSKYKHSNPDGFRRLRFSFLFFLRQWPLTWLVSICWLVSLIAPEQVMGQRLFRGVVMDNDSGETLPSVTLFVEQTATGTTTNAVGMFELSILALPATIVVRHIGYETMRIQVDERVSANLTVRLVPIAYELEELVVTDEDPAYNIMRKVIERKQKDREMLTAYSAESYTRFMLYSEFDLAQMKETIANHYWLPEQGTRSLVRARRAKPGRSPRFRFAATQHVPDFYDDIISIYGLDLIGPTHPDALDVYTFTLGGQRSLDGRKVYDIYFSPRSGYDTAFIGHVAVLDEAYVILKIHARPAHEIVRPVPVKDWDIYYEQQFAAQGDSLWLPIDLLAEGYVSFGRLGVSYPTARFRQVSRLSHHVLNGAPPDSMFARNSFIAYAPDVDRQDYLFRWNPGLIPMTPKETEEVVTMDPGRGLYRHFRPIGVLSNYTAIRLEEDEVVEGEAEVPIQRDFGVFSSVRLAYNRVEGGRPGLARTIQLGRSLFLDARVGYAIEAKEPVLGGDLTYRWGQRSRALGGFVRVGLASEYATQYTSRAYTEFVNAVTSYVGWEDYFDYYWETSQSVGTGVHLRPIQARLTVDLSRENHRSVASIVDDKGRFFGSTPRPNPSIVEADYTLLKVGLQLGNVSTRQFRAHGSGVRFQGTFNLNDNDAPAFSRYEMLGAVTLPTFYTRRSWPNALHLRVFGTTYTGSLPAEMVSVLDVSRRPIAPFGAFKSLTGLPIKGGNAWSVAWEHDFATTLFEYLGLWRIARSGLGVTIHGTHGQALASAAWQARDPFSLYNDAVHHEFGISITQWFNLPIRFDITKNLDQRRLALSLGITKKL